MKLAGALLLAIGALAPRAEAAEGASGDVRWNCGGISSGGYCLLDLPPGTYRVEARLGDFTATSTTRVPASGRAPRVTLRFPDEPSNGIEASEEEKRQRGSLKGATSRGGDACRDSLNISYNVFKESRSTGRSPLRAPDSWSFLYRLPVTSRKNASLDGLRPRKRSTIAISSSWPPCERIVSR